MEININLLPWRTSVHKLNQRKFFIALIALVLTLFIGIGFYKLFNDELIKWQERYEHAKNFLMVNSSGPISLQNKKIIELLNIISVLPKNIYLTQVNFTTDTVSIRGIAQSYNAIMQIIQLLKNTVYLSKTKLISAEQSKSNFKFKINIGALV